LLLCSNWAVAIFSEFMSGIVCVWGSCLTVQTKLLNAD
jgi:hypothetical protein